jgi:hypothetical protein
MPMISALFLATIMKLSHYPAIELNTQSNVLPVDVAVERNLIAMTKCVILQMSIIAYRFNM